MNNLQADLQAVCPGLLEITAEASNQWFLNFLLSVDTLPSFARLRRSTLLKIPSVGVKSAAIIEHWQKRARFHQEVEWVGEMIQEDARRCVELDEKIQPVRNQGCRGCQGLQVAKTLRSIRGLVPCALQNWPARSAPSNRSTYEGSLSLYLGMSTLDNRSGKYQGTKAPKHVNTRAKAAMMIALDQHVSKVCTGVAEVLREETKRGKETPQPGCPSSRSTPLSDHLQNAH